MAEHCGMEFSEIFASDGPCSSRSLVLKVSSDSLSRTLHDVTFPDKGGGFSYYPIGSLSNRFIIWRSHGENLELSEVSLDESLCNNTVTICFSGSAIIDCEILECSSYIECLVCTSNGASRISFPQPQSSSPKCSIFSSGRYQSHFYPIKGLQPQLIRAAKSNVHREAGDAYFVYGMSTGSLLAACIPFGSTEAVDTFEVHQASMIQKLWNGITPFTGKSEQDSTTSASDMVFVTLTQEEQLLLSVCRDHRLRLWDFKHRHCLTVLDLLDFLPEQEHRAIKLTNLQTQFAPGIYHRIAQHPLRSSNNSSQLWLVYLSLSPTSASLGSDSSIGPCALSGAALNYWCWIELNPDRVKLRDRSVLRVLSVQPVVMPRVNQQSTNPVLGSISPDSQETTVLDFVAARLSDPLHWDDGDNKDDDEGLGNVSHMSMESEPTDPKLLQGIWWIAHQTDNRHDALESQYNVCWSAADKAPWTSTVSKHCLAIPPGCRPYETVPSWRRLPPLLIEEHFSTHLTGTPSLEEVERFLDFMFEPGRLSWFAIASALKSLRSSHQLPDSELYSTVENLDELRSHVWRTLTDNSLYRKDTAEFLTVIKTFYTTAMDYHEYALQPLGLFEIPYGTALLRTSAHTHTPFAPGLVIVRRWGFSVLRPLVPFERLLWNQQPDRPLNIGLAVEEDEPPSIAPWSPSVAQALANLVARSRILLHNLCADRQWPNWEQALYAPTGTTSMTDPSTLARTVLKHLGELDGPWVSAPFCDLGDWKRAVFDQISGETYLQAFAKLVDLVEDLTLWSHVGSSGAPVKDRSFDELDDETTDITVPGTGAFSCCTHNPHQGIGTKFCVFGINFLAQALAESTETRLQLSFALLVLLTRFQLDPISVDFLPGGGDTRGQPASCTELLARLDELVRGLRVVRWLGRTRMSALPDAGKLSDVREQLNILGLEREPIADHAFEQVHWDTVMCTKVPGLTLLEQLLLSSWYEILPKRLASNSAMRLVRPWALRCAILVPRLSVELNPMLSYGRGLVPVLKHLLLGGRSSALLHLSALLSPTDRTSVDGVSPDFELSGCDVMSSDGDVGVNILGWCWNGDYSVIHLCVGLAHLWSGQPELAEEDFVEASDWLARYVQASARSAHSSWPVAVPFCRLSTSIKVDNLLLCNLFSKAFSPEKLFCTNETGFCPEEAQIRFLMKVMPVLESQDCVTQVINLVEFGLNRLANIHLTASGPSASGEDTTTNGARAPWSRRVTAVLAGLHAHRDGPDEGFLCEPAPDSELLAGDSPNGKLYARLADLEAALWTRMFKHQLALGDYTRAFMLIRSNPDSARRRDCLRQFIVTLCDRGEAAMLVSFHYGAAEDEFLLILEARARATDVLPSTMPSDPWPGDTQPLNPYYDVLYAFHIRRANYRAAAMTMFEHAYRLAEETTCSMAGQLNAGGFRAGGARLLYGLQRQAACLLAAINVLYLVPREHQWLVRPGSAGCDVARPIESDVARPVETTSLAVLMEDDDEWAFAETEDVEVSSTSTNAAAAEQLSNHNDDIDKRDLDEPLTVNHNGTQVNDYRLSVDTVAPGSSALLRSGRLSKDKHILQMTDLLNLYILTRARLRLTRTSWEQGMLRAGPSGPCETVQALLVVALYDEAVRVAEAFDLVDFRPIIDAVASRCSELAQHIAGNAGQPPTLPGLTTLPSALSHEADLVVQSLNNLTSKQCPLSTNVVEDMAMGMEQSMVQTSRGFTGRLGNLYWRLLELILTRLDPPGTTQRCGARTASSPRDQPGQLHLLACECLLRSGPGRLHLPTWLVNRLQSATARTCRPVQLLRLYWRFDRVQEAYCLVMDMLSAATGLNKSDPAAFGLQASLPDTARLSKNQSAPPVWIPHNMIVRLAEALNLLSKDYPACKVMESNLRTKMTDYLTRLQSCNARLAAA